MPLPKTLSKVATCLSLKKGVLCVEGIAFSLVDRIGSLCKREREKKKEDWGHTVSKEECLRAKQRPRDLHWEGCS